MTAQKRNRSSRFEALVAQVEAGGSLRTSVLARSKVASRRALQAAKSLLGGIARGSGRVSRVANLLEELCAADAASRPSLRRPGRDSSS